VGQKTRTGGGSWSRYYGQIHPVLVAVLALFTVVLGIYGWILRPQSGGFPSVPENISVTVTDRGGSGGSGVTETLSRNADNGGTLVLQVGQAVPAAGSLTAPWSMEIDNIGSGKVCTPADYDNTTDAAFAFPLPRAHITHPVETSDTPGYFPHPTLIQSKGFPYVKVCWSSDAPVSLNGSYLSALFPPVAAPYPKSISVTRELDADAGDTGNYANQSPVQPTGSTPQSWRWSSRIGSSVPVRLSAVNTSGIQHDSYNGFLSGIVFGIAGGALISLVTELVTPLRPRRHAAGAG
jgi:hypothetical protein